MRIEISTGVMSGAAAISEYQSCISDLISSTESMISCFKTIKKETSALNGGIGSLTDALDELDSRIMAEEQKKEDMVGIQKKSNDFLELATRVDREVASLVNRNKDEFYRVNPWLKPPEEESEEDKNIFEKGWDWVCGAGEAIGEGLEAAWDWTCDAAGKAWDWTCDTAKKAWDGAVAFYQENKKIIDTALIVVGAIAAVAAVVASGGGALVFALGALGCSAGTAAAISGAVAAVAVVSTVASSTLNIIDIWADVDNPTFQKWKKGLNIVSTVSNITYSAGNLYNSFHHITPEQAKFAMKNIVSGNRGVMFDNGQYVSFLSDYQPGADSNIHRELLTEDSTNHFYSCDMANGKKIYVSADPCTASGVANVVGNSNEEFIVISGTHGGPMGELSFDGSYQFFVEDCNSFVNMPNVQVINLPDQVLGLDSLGNVLGYNKPYMQSLFGSGKNIVCAWCFSDRSMLVKDILGLR